MAKRFEKAKEYTRKYQGILLPCRTCGNTRIEITSERIMFPKARDAWCVNCTSPKCDCTAANTSIKAAIQRWNEMQGGERP